MQQTELLPVFLLLIVFFIVSFFLNWGVQLGYYLRVKRRNAQAFAGQRTLLNYATGYIGDAVIVPVINVLIYIVIQKYIKNIVINDILVIVLIALIGDAVTHFIQGARGLTNWSMPQPFRWNGAGYWHMVSFPIQIGYILIFFYTIIVYKDTVFLNQTTLLATCGIFLLMVLFLALFWYDYRPRKS